MEVKLKNIFWFFLLVLEIFLGSNVIFLSFLHMVRFSVTLGEISLGIPKPSNVKCHPCETLCEACFSDGEKPHLSWGDEHGLLKYPLNLSDIAMCPKSGRVYHPAPYRQGNA